MTLRVRAGKPALHKGLASENAKAIGFLLVHVSKRVVAREWLIFLLLFCLGCPVSFFLGHFQGHTLYWRHSDYWSYDDFWNHSFGLDNPRNLALWLVPYLAVMLTRSIWWSIKALNISKRVLCGIGILAAVLVLGVAAIVIINAKENERQAASAPSWDETAAVPSWDETQPVDGAISRARENERYAAELIRRHPILFHGTVSAVNTNAGTFTIAGHETPRVFKITDITVITKAGNPATQRDILVNEQVSGSYLNRPEGMLEVRTLKLGSSNIFDLFDEPAKTAKPFDPDEYLGIKKAATPSPTSPR